MIDKQSFLWHYLSSGQKGLIDEGLHLLEHAQSHPHEAISDYSFVVFPFAKAYEGFLKQLFLDLELITEHQYQSKHFRIGKALNPNLWRHLGTKRSVYGRLVNMCDDPHLADNLWDIWTRGRNLVFHYFPHNLKAISLEDARLLIHEILTVMNKAVTECNMEGKMMKRVHEMHHHQPTNLHAPIAYS